MSNNPLIQYWDSMVIIHRIQRTPAYIGDLEQLTLEAENGKLNIVLSTFSIAEIYKDPDGGVLSEEENQKIVGLFENPYFIVRPLTLPIALLARRVSREFGTKPKDAVHLATAVYWNVPVFLTYEDALLKKNGKIGDPPLIIETPRWTGQQKLTEADNAQESEKRFETTDESPDVVLDVGAPLLEHPDENKEKENTDAKQVGNIPQQES